MRIARYEMRSPNEPLVRVEVEIPPLAPGEALIEVAGCGICHTDLAFLDGSVPTRHPLPLTLGHEISGRVIASRNGDGARGDDWVGRAVIVPAVIPCGECDPCRRGRGSICRRQIFPGNDIHGGFASHVCVPVRGLCPVPGAEGDGPVGKSGASLADLSVMADAVTTAYQAVIRSGLEPGDLAVFVGAGGVGGFGVQIAAALGGTSVAIDIDDSRLEALRGHGASLTLNTKTMDTKSVRQAVKEFARTRGLPESEWKIFETSGTTPGQDVAFKLLTFGAHLSVVGYTPADVSVRLSNLMAFDATAAGNWGCLPERYPEALRLILDGHVAVPPFVERHPLSSVNEVLPALRAGRIRRRVVLIPDESALKEARR